MAKSEKNSETTKAFRFKLERKVFLYGFIIIGLVCSVLITIFVLLLGRIYPGISIAQTPMGLLTPEQTYQVAEQTVVRRAQTPLQFSYLPATASASPQTFTITTSNVYQADYATAITAAWELGHSTLFIPPQSITIPITFNEQFKQQVATIKQQVDKEAIDSQLKVEDNQIIVSPSQEGLVVDEQTLQEMIRDYLNTGKLTSTNLPLKKTYPKLSYETGLKLKQRLEEIRLAPLQLQFQNQNFPLDLTTLISFIDLKRSQPSIARTTLFGEPVNLASLTIDQKEVTDSTIALNNEKVIAFLEPIASQIDQEVKEPLFNFDPTSPSRVKEFSPPQEGRKLNIEKTAQNIAESLLTSNQQTIPLVVETTKPQNKLVNDLGIKELIGRGVSNFAGSIENRIFNVNLAASRINGILIAPGEEFSFNKAVGDISAATGFKQAYVIKSGRTVLDDGGGVCQVSTTIFRAALNTGVPITARTAHAYRVGYYEQGFPPGLDATIFYPSVDFKFKNDTPAHILVQAVASGTTLTVELYGTSDGRTTSVSTPKIVSQSPALPELRQDDPTLAKGVVKQVDFAAAGANVVFSRTIQRPGQEPTTEIFRSNYRPWQAVFLVGTKES